MNSRFVLDPSPALFLVQVPVALAVIALIALHIVALGYWVTRWLGYRPSDLWTQLSVRGAAGVTLLGFEMLALGHLNALTAVSVYLSSCLMAVGILLAYPRFAAWKTAASGQFRAAVHEDKIIAFSCAALLLVVIVSGLRPSYESDEVEYHWAAATMWAREGHWHALPFPYLNGPALIQMIYTFSAIFSSNIAAHWTHSLCLLVLVAGCAALTRAMGGAAIAGIGACLSCPVVVNQSSIAWSDIAAAALVVGAYAALFSEADAGSGDAPPRRAAVLVAGLLLAGAVSVKPFTLVALPVAVLYIAWRSSGVRGQPLSVLRKVSVARALLLTVPVLVILGVWMLHTHTLTGRLWVLNAHHYARSPSDRMWQTGEAAGRIPSLKDIAVLPFVPIATSVLGQKEPYGGRTGLLLLAAVPLGLLGLRRLADPQRKKGFWLLAGAAAYFLLLGPIAIKTRFHLFVWVVGACFAAIGYNVVRTHPSALVKRIGAAGYYGLMWVGMADIAHVLLRRLTPFY